MFELTAPFKPTGQQPAAIDGLVLGLKNHAKSQTLLGVTGSGKTFILANVIQQLQRPALILAPNKTLAAQLYGEMKQFFPNNAVEFFVSYYDYYQPEAYIAATDTFIEKDAAVNSHIEQMRLSATKALLTRKDSIIVATVSAIYGLGDPNSYLQMVLHLQLGEVIDQQAILFRLAELQYTRNDVELKRGTFRVRGELIDIHPAEVDKQALRVHFFGDEIERLSLFDPLTGEVIKDVARYTIYPKTHYVTPAAKIATAVELIEIELAARLEFFQSNNQLLEAQRLEQRVKYDVAMLKHCGFCMGVENYSRHFTNSKPGEPPPTLMDYLPNDALLFIDESHVTVPQLGGMVKGDQSRKNNLIQYGFRLPSAADNRPLAFAEFERLMPQTVFVSATPGPYELDCSSGVVECLVRPTGIVDPVVEVRPATGQVEDCLGELRHCVANSYRALITTLTKKMAEQLTDYLGNHGLKVRYLHSDIDTVERVAILDDLRKGVFDILVGINLLREGLDLPEVALVCVLDADKEGFLRSRRSLIQTIGRAARHAQGKAILYADKITGSMQQTLEESARRREFQLEYNLVNNIKPVSATRGGEDVLEVNLNTEPEIKAPLQLSPKEAAAKIKELEPLMYQAAADLDFELAAKLRDEIAVLQSSFCA